MKIRTLTGMLAKEYRNAEMYVVCPKCQQAWMINRILFKHGGRGYAIHLSSEHVC